MDYQHSTVLDKETSLLTNILLLHYYLGVITKAECVRVFEGKTIGRPHFCEYKDNQLYV